MTITLFLALKYPVEPEKTSHLTNMLESYSTNPHMLYRILITIIISVTFNENLL